MAVYKHLTALGLVNVIKPIFNPGSRSYFYQPSSFYDFLITTLPFPLQRKAQLQLNMLIGYLFSITCFLLVIL